MDWKELRTKLIERVDDLLEQLQEEKYSLIDNIIESVRYISEHKDVYQFDTPEDAMEHFARKGVGDFGDEMSDEVRNVIKAFLFPVIDNSKEIK